MEPSKVTSTLVRVHGLAEGQLTQEVSGECTNLTFNVFSPHNSEELTLYASDGPCNDAELSKGTLQIEFLTCSCPIGLQPSENKINCVCECHRDISQHVEQCDPHTGFIVTQSQSNVWISYTNKTGYLVYPNCPFDYCNSLSVSVDLNQPDVQCAFNRSSLLCMWILPTWSQPVSW